MTATTPATPDTTAPSVPAGLSATATGATTVDLSWNAVTDSGGSGLKDYIVYRNGVAVATVATTSFADTGLTASTLYAYEIAARDNALNVSARSVARNVATPATSDTTPPSVPGALSATAMSSTQVDLTWGAATDNVRVSAYSVERCVGPSCVTFTQLATPAGTSFSDTALPPRRRTVIACERSSRRQHRAVLQHLRSKTDAAADTTPPSAPGTLTSSVFSVTQINLSWIAATDDVGVTGYRVERCTGAGCANFTQIATPTGTIYSDTGLTASTSYSYRVRAVDAASNPGPFSNTGSATTEAAPDITPPIAPAALMSSVVSSTEIDLNWNAATG